MLDIHLQNQTNTQIKHIPKSTVFHHSFMFRHVCAILRELVKQI